MWAYPATALTINKTSIKYKTMKTTLILASLISLPALAGQKVVIAPPPVPVIENPCANSVWSWEVAGTYSWGANDPYRNADDMPQKKMKTWGADVTMVRRLPDFNSFFKDHSLFLRLGYNWGDRNWGIGEGMSTKFSVGNLTIMPGYRMQHKLTDSLSYHVGISAGLSSRTDESTFAGTEPVYEQQRDQQGNPLYRHDTSDGSYTTSQPVMEWQLESTVGTPVMDQVGEQAVSYKGSKTTAGFAASMELGLRYAVNPCWDVFCSYQLTMTTAKTKLTVGDSTVQTNREFSHGIRMGVGCKF